MASPISLEKKQGLGKRGFNFPRPGGLKRQSECFLEEYKSARA